MHLIELLNCMNPEFDIQCCDHFNFFWAGIQVLVEETSFSWNKHEGLDISFSFCFVLYNSDLIVIVIYNYTCNILNCINLIAWE